MHEEHPIENKLKLEAERLSSELGGAPVVIVVGGDKEAGIANTLTASSIDVEGSCLRDLLGILQASIQIESLKHFYK